MNVAQDVLRVLSEAETDGPNLRLVGTLDRPLYERTDKVLRAAGGRWNRTAKAHVFSASAADAVDQVILTGSVVAPSDFGFFPTPSPVVERLLDLAELVPGHEVLEPSAGTGAIASVVAQTCTVDCVELVAANADAIATAGYARVVVTGDFLDCHPLPFYDRVIMNPPFARRADVAHVQHAFGFLRPGGRLVSVMSAGVTFRRDRLTMEFRGLVEAHGGTLYPLPPDSFKVSGTRVSTVIVVMDKGGEQ